MVGGVKRLLWTTRSAESRPKHQLGWMNYRTATTLTIEETPTHVVIKTSVGCLVLESLSVTILNEFLYIEGRLDIDSPSPQFGRYVRHIGDLLDVDLTFLDVNCTQQGELTIRMSKLH